VLEHELLLPVAEVARVEERRLQVDPLPVLAPVVIRAKSRASLCALCCGQLGVSVAAPAKMKSGGAC
jgi:hypothetical protein